MQRLPTDPDYKRVPANSLREFRGLGPNEKIHLPELPENRKCTDVCCAGFMAVVLCGWIVLSVYVGMNSDMRYILNGRDDCDNVCGVNNKKTNVDFMEMKCPEEDYTDYPILLYKRWNSTSFTKKCIKADDCKGGKILQNRHCYPEEANLDDLPWIYMISWVTVAIIGLISVALNIVVIVCFRLNTKITFITLMVFNFIIMGIGCALLWINALNSDEGSRYLTAAILATIFLVVFLALCYLLRKKFKLIIRVYEETLEAIFNCPMIFIVPVLSLVYTALFNLICAYMLILMVSCAFVLPSITLILVYFLVLFVIYYWMFNFTTGCECIVIAGTIAAHYFCRNKSELKSPVLRSFQILVRYHLGSVALGSLIITIITILKKIAENAYEQDNSAPVKILGCLCMILLSCLEDVVRYLSKKAYIMIAIHGQSFCKSAARSVRLMWHFLLDLIGTDFIGGAAVNAGGSFCILIPMVIGFFVGKSLMHDVDEHFLITMGLGFILAAIITFYCCQLLNVALETTFLSFCEDKLLNDGSSQRPYFMSARLREVVEDGWKDVDEKRQRAEERQRRQTQTEEQRN